jgi:hypothetical protein
MGKLSSLTDDEFSHTFNSLGPSKTASHYGVGLRTVYERRRRLEARTGVSIKSPFAAGGVLQELPDYPDHVPLTVKDGTIIVGADAHIWPGERSPALRAFIKFIKDLGPKAVILNGDVMDFPRISRHAPIGWEKNPQASEEIEAAQDALHDIEQAAGNGVRKIWPVGNHDLRFESQIAQHCPEYARIKGIHLYDHFPNWERGWSVEINNWVIVKHRYKSGKHAASNNALNSGRPMITGHLHQQTMSPITDYNGTRDGIELGCLANIYHPAFRNYTENNPRNWVAGFGVFTFRDSVMLPPEFVRVMSKTTVAFRGELIEV